MYNNINILVGFHTYDLFKTVEIQEITEDGMKTINKFDKVIGLSFNGEPFDRITQDYLNATNNNKKDENPEIKELIEENVTLKRSIEWYKSIIERYKNTYESEE